MKEDQLLIIVLYSSLFLNSVIIISTYVVGYKTVTIQPHNFYCKLLLAILMCAKLFREGQILLWIINFYQDR